jgi:hypothetical protein
MDATKAETVSSANFSNAFEDMDMRLPAKPILAALLLLVSARTAQACPNCKDGLAHYDASNGRAGYSANGLQQGFSYSTVFMLSMPLSLIGAGGFMVRRLAKQGRLPEL